MTAHAPTAPTATNLPPSPYRGLRFFTETDEDAAFFFGRQEEVEINAANLLSARLTLLYGPSGVGKSSVLLAGVVNSLRKRSRENLAEEGEAGFAVVVVRSWSDPDPLQTVAAAVRAEATSLLERDDLPEPPDGATLAEVLDHWSAQVQGKLLVIFDQFEEYFLYHDHESGPRTFDAEFPQAVNQSKLRTNFLLSIRDDALARLDRFKGRIPNLFDNRLQIEDLSPAAAREAVKLPIEKYNEGLPDEQHVEIKDDLVKAVIAACAAEGLTLTAGGESVDVQTAVPSTLNGRTRIKAPFLQLVLERLWHHATEAGERTLTLTQLDGLGGVTGIVENHLRSALDSLSEAERAIAAKCFRLLVSPSKTKIAYPASALTDLAGRPEEEVTVVLDKLCAAESGRILRDFAPAQGEGGKSYELFHDLLAEPITAWRKEYEEEERLREEREVEAQRRKAEARRRRRYLWTGGVLIALVAVFAGLAVWAWGQRNASRSATAVATSVALASAADQQLASHRDIALLLSLEANHAHPTPQAESSMLTALNAVRRSGERILRGNHGGVTAVAFTPQKKGTTLATADSDGTVLLWNAATRKLLGEPLDGNHGAVTAVALEPGQAHAGRRLRRRKRGALGYPHTCRALPPGQQGRGHHARLQRGRPESRCRQQQRNGAGLEHAQRNPARPRLARRCDGSLGDRRGAGDHAVVLWNDRDLAVGWPQLARSGQGALAQGVRRKNSQGDRAQPERIHACRRLRARLLCRQFQRSRAALGPGHAKTQQAAQVLRQERRQRRRVQPRREDARFRR